MNDFLRIGWVRHGETDWNRAGKLQGQTDIPLNDTGRWQATCIARRLAADQHKYQWAAIIASDLSRAADTAHEIAKALPLPIELDARLREVSFGDLEGTTRQERLDRWGENRPDPELTNRETDEQAANRALSSVWHWLDKYDDRPLLFVTHGGLIARTIDALVPGLSETGYIANTSLTILEKRQDKWYSALFNCQRHMQDAKQ